MEMALFAARLVGKEILVRDVNGLMSAAVRFGKGDLSSWAQPGLRCKEMRDLAGTFNEMAQALEARQTELEDAARSLSLMRNMYKNILESMPSAFVGVDRQDVVTHWNCGAERLCGTLSDHALGKPLQDACPWLAEQVPCVGQ